MSTEPESNCKARTLGLQEAVRESLQVVLPGPGVLASWSCACAPPRPCPAGKTTSRRRVWNMLDLPSTPVYSHNRKVTQKSALFELSSLFLFLSYGRRLYTTITGMSCYAICEERYVSETRTENCTISKGVLGMWGRRSLVLEANR